MPGDDCSFGNVGVPLVCNLVKLVDVPEMQYTANDVVNGAPCPRGEVCFKGTNICHSTTAQHTARPLAACRAHRI